MRDRNGRPIVGTAMTRPPRTAGGGLPIFAFGGFGWNYGYGWYDPWYGDSFYYGGSAWLWGRNGLWYDPYAYYPYNPYSYSSGYYADEPAARAPAKRAMGSLRLKASPSVAKVYVDGTLMGTVADFAGLTHHLKIEPGAHTLELRADGYRTMATDVTVTTGTTTVRLTLKKK
jgi:hypothetical protein